MKRGETAEGENDVANQYACRKTSAASAPARVHEHSRIRMPTLQSAFCPPSHSLNVRAEKGQNFDLKISPPMSCTACGAQGPVDAVR
jgi:hypothetical protein